MRGERTPAALVPEGGAPAPAPRPRVDDACSSEEIFADVSDDDEDSSRRARLRREQTEARCVLALFSVALLWCSSLSVADALVRGVLPSPHSRESVVDAVHVAFEHIVRADEDYLRCARRETFACAANVRAAVLAESRRAEVIEAREVELAREAERDADACARLESRAWSLAADAVARGTNHSSSGTNRSRSSPPAFTNASASLRAASPNSDDDVISIPWHTLPNASSPAHASTSSSCASPSARAAVRAKLRDPTGAFVSAADDLSASAATFRADSDGTLDAVLAVAERRVAYDKQYAENKTAALTALEAALVANATGEVVALARTAAGALEAANARASEALSATAADAARALAAAAADAEATLEAYAATVRVFVTEAMTKLASAKAWFEAFEALGWIASQIPDALAGATPDVTPPASLPSLDPGIDLDVVAKADAIVASVSSRVEAVSNAVGAAIEDVGRAASRVPLGVAGVAGAALPNAFDDYLPPPRGEPFAAFAARRRADADASRSALEDALNSTRRAIEDARVEVASEFDRRAAAASNASRDARAASRDASDRAASGAGAFGAEARSRLSDAFAGASSVAALLGIEAPDSVAWFTTWNLLSAAADGLVGADLAYRFARSAKEASAHFSRRGHALPLIDLTAASAARADPPTAAVRVASTLGHPATLAAVRFAALALAATLASAAYYPFVDAHRRGCVATCGGTFVTRNFHALAHNYAASDGARAVARGVAVAEGERRDACAAKTAASAARVGGMREAAGASRRVAAEALAGARSLVACVDVDALARRSETSPSELRALERSAALGARAASAASDDDPWSRCANAERLLAESASLGDPLAGAPGSSPGLSAFDCAALPACAPSCAGPNGRLLGSATRVAGCAAEDALHFTVARFLLTGVVFVAANAARGAAVRGAAAVHWKALAGDAGFRFEGTLRADGGVEPPSGAAGKRSEKSVRAVARAEIKRAAAKHVRGGGVALALAALAQIPGLVALGMAKRAAGTPRARCDY